MSKYYKKLNTIGITVSIGSVEDTEEIPSGTISIDKSEYDRIDKTMNVDNEIDELSGDEIISDELSSPLIEEGGLD